MSYRRLTASSEPGAKFVVSFNGKCNSCNRKCLKYNLIIFLMVPTMCLIHFAFVGVSEPGNVSQYAGGMVDSRCSSLFKGLP